MIILCEPQCKGYSHEQFNAGFLYGYSLSYPEEQILFFGEKNHNRCIRSILDSSSLEQINVEFHDIEIPEGNSLVIMIKYLKVIDTLLNFAKTNKCQKISFLSIYSFNLLPLKLLLHHKYNHSFLVHIMMHGTLEFVKRKNYSFFRKFLNLLKKIIAHFNKISQSLVDEGSQNIYFYEKLFKKALHVFGNKHISYYVFREDSLKKVHQYLPSIASYFRWIDLPYIYKNDKPRFSEQMDFDGLFLTFDKGNTSELNELFEALFANKDNSKLNPIQIIGKNTNMEDYCHPQMLNLYHMGELSRKQIEEMMTKAKYLLILYPETSYELTTSGLLFDGVAYCKPMIFLKNVCLDYYYNNYKFGYRCENLEEISKIIQKIILGEGKEYPFFCSEIFRMQSDVSIKQSFLKLRFE